MIQLFNTILVDPLLNILVFFYNTIAFHDLGLAIIFLTVLVRLIIYPLSLSQIKSQKSLAGLQEKVNAIKKQYENDKQKQTQAIMELYKQNKVNPFSSCLSILIQFPILIAVYQVFRSGILSDHLPLYSFIENPGKLSTLAFGFLDLSVRSIPLAILTGLAQFFQTKMLSRKKVPAAAKGEKGAKDESMLTAMNKNMLYFLPILTIIIGMSFASGLVFYWLISTLLTILQQFILFKKDKNLEVVKK
jgi:YidC/Oxa1 family membrane protein insertase